MLKRILKLPVIWDLVKPGYPDSARLVAQGRALRKVANTRPFYGRCLNAGCGEGLYSPFLESFSKVASISDIDLSVPSFFKERYPDPRHSIFTGSLTDLPFQEGEFDCALCTEVIEHIPDDRKALSELARVIKPGGHLLLSVPQTPAPYDPGHATQGYTFEGMRERLESAGFKVLDHADALFCGTRWIMTYWRKPWFRVGQSRVPYLPYPTVYALSLFDSYMGCGKPWDLIVLAERK
ncbi:MAG TPA: class I SAM-dependent methyltransferase [Candidatus Limnocylindria bacterium]|jgi:SAM-dependent methyltransferase|nr:class I SAM-dependent methyltransferase [Candidatus Limnocylindria bacterium]